MSITVVPYTSGSWLILVAFLDQFEIRGHDGGEVVMMGEEKRDMPSSIHSYR